MILTDALYKVTLAFNDGPLLFVLIVAILKLVVISVMRVWRK